MLLFETSNGSTYTVRNGRISRDNFLHGSSDDPTVVGDFSSERFAYYREPRIGHQAIIKLVDRHEGQRYITTSPVVSIHHVDPPPSVRVTAGQAHSGEVKLPV